MSLNKPGQNPFELPAQEKQVNPKIRDINNFLTAIRAYNPNLEEEIYRGLNLYCTENGRLNLDLAEDYIRGLTDKMQELIKREKERNIHLNRRAAFTGPQTQYPETQGPNEYHNNREGRVYESIRPEGQLVTAMVEQGNYDRLDDSLLVVSGKPEHSYFESLYTTSYDGHDMRRFKEVANELRQKGIEMGLVFDGVSSDGLSDVYTQRLASLFPFEFNNVLNKYGDNWHNHIPEIIEEVLNDLNGFAPMSDRGYILGSSTCAGFISVKLPNGTEKVFAVTIGDSTVALIDGTRPPGFIEESHFINEIDVSEKDTLTRFLGDTELKLGPHSIVEITETVQSIRKNGGEPTIIVCTDGLEARKITHNKEDDNRRIGGNVWKVIREMIQYPKKRESGIRKLRDLMRNSSDNSSLIVYSL